MWYNLNTKRNFEFIHFYWVKGNEQKIIPITQ